MTGTRLHENTLYIPRMGFFRAQILLNEESDCDCCTGNYVEELDRRYDKSVSCAQFLEYLPTERTQFHCRHLSQRCKRMYSVR